MALRFNLNKRMFDKRIADYVTKLKGGFLNHLRINLPLLVLPLVCLM